MANEAIIVELLGNKGDPLRFTIDNTTAVPKGTVMELTDPRTCVVASGAGVVIAGIAAAEKVANDGQTSIALYQNVIIILPTISGGSATLGSYVRAAAASTNEITVATTLDHETGKTIGKSLETSGASTNTMIKVRL